MLASNQSPSHDTGLEGLEGLGGLYRDGGLTGERGELPS